MLKNLFSSNVRIKILTLFLANPLARYYLREIEKLTGLQVRAVQRELLNLVEFGLLVKSPEGNRAYYQVDPEFFLLPELKSIIFKTTALGDALRGGIKKDSKIKAAFIYGSYAENRESTKSDIDLFVIGDISGRELQSLLAKPKREIHREINAALYSEKEFKEKLKKRNHFVVSVLKKPKILLKGKVDIFQAK